MPLVSVDNKVDVAISTTVDERDCLPFKAREAVRETVIRSVRGATLNRDRNRTAHLVSVLVVLTTPVTIRFNFFRQLNRTHSLSPGGPGTGSVPKKKEVFFFLLGGSLYLVWGF